MATRKGQSGPLQLTRRELLCSGFTLGGLLELTRKGPGARQLAGAAKFSPTAQGPGGGQPTGEGPATGARRAIVLGFDGVDPTLAEPWMEEGKLPNLARLRRLGGYRRMLSSNPAESPVAWSSFACGANPAQTNIFDFLRRKARSYNPEYALVTEGEVPFLESWFLRAGLALGAVLPGGMAAGVARLASRKPLWRWVSFLATTAVVAAGAVLALFRWLPRRLPKPVSLRRGQTFWEALGRAGYRTSCLRIPVAFPPEELPHGRILAGLSVPDLRKSNGTFSYYATDVSASADTEAGGKIIPVTREGSLISSYIVGPRNFTESPPTDVHLPFTVSLDEGTGSARISCQGRSQVLRPGEWSDWFELSFPLNPILHLWGMAKFHLISVAPEFRLYLSAVNFHPSRLPVTVDLTSPRRFAADLVERVGLFKTLGWDADTWGLKDGWLEEAPFLADVAATEETKWRLFQTELERDDWECFVGIFEGTDRVQHMMWWTRDPRHPAYDPKLAETFADAIAGAYRFADRVVGEVLDRYVDERTLLIVLSDHGFASFRRGVNLNTWLAREGFLALTPGTEAASGKEWNLEDLFGQGEFWPNVDWTKTKAYSLGLGQIYVNLIGREPMGAVKPGEEYRAVKRGIQEKLRLLRDPETGEAVVVDVYDRDDIYHGPYFDNAPDLVVGFEPGYRVSWQTCLGGMPPDNVEDNPEKWSGDHCSVDPHRIPGILFANRPFARTEPSIFDIAPTVLDYFGVAVPAEMDGKPLGLARGPVNPAAGVADVPKPLWRRHADSSVLSAQAGRTG